MKKLLIFALVIICGSTAFSQRLAPVKSANEKLNDEYCSGMFHTTEGTYFDLLNDHSTAGAAGYLNILDWLQGRVAGLQVYTSRNNDRIPYIRNSRASIYLDEILVSPDYLGLLPVSDIAMIKIIKAPWAGFGGPGGVIAIYTIGTDDEEEEE